GLRLPARAAVQRVDDGPESRVLEGTLRIDAEPHEASPDGLTRQRLTDRLRSGMETAQRPGSAHADIDRGPADPLVAAPVGEEVRIVDAGRARVVQLREVREHAATGVQVARAGALPSVVLRH